jgi:hypothetical protein
MLGRLSLGSEVMRWSLKANLSSTGGGGMVKGSSFLMDTKDPRKTRVHGDGLQIDLSILEILTAGGALRYSPTHIEFVCNAFFPSELS